MPKLESRFQKELIDELKERFPGCIVLKNDPGYLQGIPDLLVLYGSHWAALECKQEKYSARRPNQEYYVNRMAEMSYAAFVYPENREEIFNELERSFQTERSAFRSVPE